MRRLRLLAALVALLFFAADLARPPRRQWTVGVLVAGIHLYRGALSPRLAAGGVRCRFEPSCSRYAEVALVERGALVGGWLSIRRLARCGPWTPAGTVDPPPGASAQALPLHAAETSRAESRRRGWAKLGRR
jgi:putative membrane protein insertion efficiency factor